MRKLGTYLHNRNCKETRANESSLQTEQLVLSSHTKQSSFFPNRGLSAEEIHPNKVPVILPIDGPDFIKL